MFILKASSQQRSKKTVDTQRIKDKQIRMRCYSGLENSMDCIVHGVAKSQIQLSGHECNISALWIKLSDFIVRFCPFLQKAAQVPTGPWNSQGGTSTPLG